MTRRSIVTGFGFTFSGNRIRSEVNITLKAQFFKIEALLQNMLLGFVEHRLCMTCVFEALSRARKLSNMPYVCYMWFDHSCFFF